MLHQLSKRKEKWRCRRPEEESSRTTNIFPEVLKAISHSLTAEQIPMADTIVLPEDEDIEEEKEAEVSEDELTGTALSTQDWHKAQADDKNMFHHCQINSWTETNNNRRRKE